MTEVWKSVVGYEGLYQVSDMGNVRSEDKFQKSYGGRSWTRKGRAMKPTLARYYVVTLTKDKVHTVRYVHSLILEAFVGERPEGFQACHRDGNGKHNVLTNLRWDTATENTLDKFGHGTMPLGVKHHKNKYSEEAVMEVRRLLKEKKTLAQIKMLTGVKINTVSQIKHGRQWVHLAT